MGRREKDKPPHWQCRWPNPHIGRYWKRQLSKARRRFAKQMLLWGRGKEPLHYERECNWKTWWSATNAANCARSSRQCRNDAGTL